MPQFAYHHAELTGEANVGQADEREREGAISTVYVRQEKRDDTKLRKCEYSLCSVYTT